MNNPDLIPLQSRQRPSAARQPIRVRNLGVRYRTVKALRNVSFTAQPGRLVGIIGPNGAGKSTLIKAMLGLVPVNSGEVSYGQKPLREQRQQVAYVPQRSLIDWSYPATVWDVVMMGRTRKSGWLRSYSTTSRQTAVVALERVGMAAYRDRPIGELSGGQQQRVFLARALAAEAEIFCLDEPFVGVDQKTQGVLFDIFQELTQAGSIVLVVNHDLGESITHFDDLLLLNTEVVACGPRSQVLRSEHLYQAYGGKVIFFGEAA